MVLSVDPPVGKGGAIETEKPPSKTPHPLAKSRHLVGQYFLLTNAAASEAGRAMARQLLQWGALVIVTANEEKVAREAANELAHDVPNGVVDGLHLNPCDLDSVRSFVREYCHRHPALNVLVHGPVDEAGAHDRDVAFPLGADQALVANHLCPFLLTQLLLPLLINNAPARIVLRADASHREGDASRLRALSAAERIVPPRQPSPATAASIAALSGEPSAVLWVLVSNRTRRCLQAHADAELACMLHAAELHRRLLKHAITPSKESWRGRTTFTIARKPSTPRKLCRAPPGPARFSHPLPSAVTFYSLLRAPPPYLLPPPPTTNHHRHHTRRNRCVSSLALGPRQYSPPPPPPTMSYPLVW